MTITCPAVLFAFFQNNCFLRTYVSARQTKFTITAVNGSSLSDCQIFTRTDPCAQSAADAGIRNGQNIFTVNRKQFAVFPDKLFPHFSFFGSNRLMPFSLHFKVFFIAAICLFSCRSNFISSFISKAGR